MALELYSATYTSASDHIYNDLHNNHDNHYSDLHSNHYSDLHSNHGNHYSDLHSTAQVNTTIFSTVFNHYTEIKDLDDKNQVSIASSSNVVQNNSETQNLEKKLPSSVADCTTESSINLKKGVERDRNSCHSRKGVIKRTIMVTLLSLLVIGLAITFTLIFWTKSKSKDNTQLGRLNCGNGWEQLGEYCFFFSTYSDGVISWHDARYFCTFWKNGRLAEPNTEEKIRFIKTKAKDRQTFNMTAFWLGGSDMQTTYWRWVSNNSRISYTNWNVRTSVGAKNKEGNKHCLCLYRPYDFEWKDESCSQTFSFICEKRVGT